MCAACVHSIPTVRSHFSHVSVIGTLSQLDHVCVFAFDEFAAGNFDCGNGYCRQNLLDKCPQNSACPGKKRDGTTKSDCFTVCEDGMSVTLLIGFESIAAAIVAMFTYSAGSMARCHRPVLLRQQHVQQQRARLRSAQRFTAAGANLHCRPTVSFALAV